MQRIGGRDVYSASDLNHFLECAHIMELDKLVLSRAMPKPAASDRLDVVASYGELHEQAYLERIRAAGHPILEIERERGEDGLVAGARRTEEAMARGVPYIAQAAFFDGTWVGYADIVRRIEVPCARWAWSYEAVDAKLARADKPYFVLQLCNYTEQIGRVQRTPSARMALYLGSGEERSYRYADFEAFYRRVKQRFLAAVVSDGDTYPFAIPFCDVCRFAGVCAQRRADDDHPSLTAFSRRDQIERLAAARPPITTMAALATATDGQRPADMAPSTFAKLRRQAAVQVRSRIAGDPVFELLPVEIGRGLAIIAPPSKGDVFFDMEGDPFADGGLEYLFGFVTADGGAPAFTYFWADDGAEEKTSFERFVDFVVDRLERFPDLHVYHYAAYETTALRRLMIKHLTREREVDELLRKQIFVDLYAAVRQGLVVPGYSIKDLEHFYWRHGRAGDVTTAMDSVLAFERWRHYRKEEDRRHILAYNEVDCQSTLALREFLLERRTEAYARFGVPLPLPERPAGEIKEETLALRRRQKTLVDRLEALVPTDPAARDGAQRALSLLATLVHYHRREAKPVWWEFFDRCAQQPEELVEDGVAIGDVRPYGDGTPERVKRSLIFDFAFPPQQHKVDVGDAVYDGYGVRAGVVVGLDDAAGTIALRRKDPLPADPPLRALIPMEHFDTRKIETALCEFAEAELATAVTGQKPRFRAGRSILHREAPRVCGVAPGKKLQDGAIELDEIKALCRGLDASHLFIQGPPGSGKTFTGARLAVDLLQRGRRIAVSANSHKAINNLLDEIEEVTHDVGHVFRGAKKVGTDEDGYRSPLANPMIDCLQDKDACLAPDLDLVAGTAWLFAEPEFRERFDYLFVDEAGQVSLANALAMSVVAENVVLLGDPLQLAQVSHGAQPEGAAASVLEHLLGDEATIPPDRGVFLTKSFRMHPAVCSFVSETIYDGRLEPAAGCERQRVDAAGLEGAGLRFIRVAHDGDPVRSPEEAEVIADVVRAALAGSVTERSGASRQMTPADVLVVAPYNMQVKLIRETLAKAGLEHVRVGTVDKFQGQEAPVVVYSMATPSAADVPHGLEFLFSRNRLNVAVSRAKCWSVIVASPRLLDANCRTVDQMRLVNSLCKFAESAD